MDNLSASRRLVMSHSSWTHATTVAILITIDQGAKYYFQQTTGVFMNHQASFSLPIPPWLIIIMSITLIASLAHMLFRPSTPRSMTYGLILILSGGVSNIADRIIYGYAQDIIAISSARFNIADIYIVSGSILLLLGVYQSELKSVKDHKKE